MADTTRDISVNIVERGGMLEERNESGWAMEVNLVSWNEGKPKIDIRSWSENHERMSRGVTLTEDQARKLSQILSSRYKDRSLSAPDKDSTVHNRDQER